MSMNDDEFDMVNKKCNEFLKKDKIGKIMSSDLKHVLERIHLEGYNLGKSQIVQDTNSVPQKHAQKEASP